jgi:hypothetical protein
MGFNFLKSRGRNLIIDNPNYISFKVSITEPLLTTVNCLYVCTLTPPICRLAPCLYISFVDPRTHCGRPRTIGNELENKKERERELDRPPAGRSKRFSNFFSLSIRY